MVGRPSPLPAGEQYKMLPGRLSVFIITYRNSNVIHWARSWPSFLLAELWTLSFVFNVFLSSLLFRTPMSLLWTMFLPSCCVVEVNSLWLSTIVPTLLWQSVSRKLVPLHLRYRSVIFPVCQRPPESDLHWV